MVNWLGLPNKLIDHRQGIVVDDNGVPVTQSKTSKTLRSYHRWFTTLGETKHEVDEAGNWAMTTGLESLEGGFIDVPFGHMRFKTGQTFDVDAFGDIKLRSKARLDSDSMLGFKVSTPLAGEVSATATLAAKSTGPITIETPTPFGVMIGMSPIKYPVLVANPTYMSTLMATWGGVGAEAAVTAAHAATAAAAWAAMAVIAAALDPSGTLSAVCGSAAATATALAAASTTTGTLVSAHLPTLSPMPAGCVSIRTISD